MLAVDTWFPNTIQLVVLLPGCEVMKFVVCPSLKYIVTVNIDVGATRKLIGSETTSAPFGMV
jgi:hypothetical protein